MSMFKVSRRSFIAGVGALAAVAPTIVRGQQAERVFKFAVVGCGRHGRFQLPHCSRRYACYWACRTLQVHTHTGLDVR